jgi:uroporphyrinogen decarboxylase
VGNKVAIQGNLDTAVLYSSPDVIREQVMKLLAAYGHGSGHIFNLGHGIHPDVNPEHVAVLVDAVHELSKPYHVDSN